VPGPICFGRSGTQPTVTDANAVLGRINAENPIGLRHIARLDVGAARLAIGALGAQLGLDVEQTAEAILTIVNHVMARRTRLLTVEQGHDPRDFALVAFGGAGPLHGAAIMREVGIRTMLLPPHPGVLCALGCALADIRTDFSQTVERPTSQLEAGFIQAVLARQSQEGEAPMASSGLDLAQTYATHAAEMSYLGQIHTLRVPIKADWSVAEIEAAFETVYRSEYGNTLSGIPKMLVSLKTAVHGKRDQPESVAGIAGEAITPQPRARREIHFGRWITTPIYDRRDLLPGMTFTGPAIVEQADTTSVIEPGMTARVDARSNILVELAP
jgi:N-methylhydantoinase A